MNPWVQSESKFTLFTNGAEASAIVYSLVETAKTNRLKIYEYLKHLLTF